LKTPKPSAPALLLVLSLVGTYCQAKERTNTTAIPLPPTLIGTWQVAGARIDTSATRTTYYQRNDPRLTGRQFVIASQKLTVNIPPGEQCNNPKAKIIRATAAELFKKSMGGDAPTPKDYEFPLADNAQVEVLTLNCDEGLFGGHVGIDGGIMGAWIVILSKDQLAIHWSDETVLLLNRLSDNAKPIASFNCNKASTTVEKTICSSVALAAYDQSVAQAYNDTVKYLKEAGNADTLVQLKNTQKQWLTQRNACGSDTKCLEKAMADRLEVIQTSLQ
jgi:uncharacterized protein YecT (DUF1311 family)